MIIVIIFCTGVPHVLVCFIGRTSVIVQEGSFMVSIELKYLPASTRRGTPCLVSINSVNTNLNIRRSMWAVILPVVISVTAAVWF